MTPSLIAMLTLKTSDLSPMQLQNYLQYAIAPRPICFASTIDAEGNINLSPFSFFNMFSTNPPICIFSPARRVRDNTTKHSLENVLQVKECVINIVDYSMVQQMSLASTEYAKGVNEFEKAGFTMLPSQLVTPPRVAEAPVQLECVVNQVIPLGTAHGAGNLVLAEIKLIHIKEEILGFLNDNSINFNLQYGNRGSLVTLDNSELIQFDLESFIEEEIKEYLMKLDIFCRIRITKEH